MKDIAVTKLITALSTALDNSQAADATNEIDTKTSLDALIALIVATNLSIPAEKTTAGVFYASNHLDKVMNLVNLINENYFVDTTKILEMVKDFWITRYYAVHPTTFDIQAMLNISANCTCYQTNPNFNSTVNALMSKLYHTEKGELNRLAGGLSKLLNSGE